MGRSVLYTILGGLISVIFGLVFAANLFGEDDPRVGYVGIASLLIGGFVFFMLARWMNTRGNTQLMVYEKRPYVMFATYGVVIGLLLSFNVAHSIIDPTDSHPFLAMGGIALGTIAGGFIGKFVATRIENPRTRAIALIIAIGLLFCALAFN